MTVKEGHLRCPTKVTKAWMFLVFVDMLGGETKHAPMEAGTPRKKQTVQGPQKKHLTRAKRMFHSRPCSQAVQKSRGKTLPSRFKATMLVKITWESWFVKNWREILGFKTFPKESRNLLKRDVGFDQERFLQDRSSAAEWPFGFIVQIGKASGQH